MKTKFYNTKKMIARCFAILAGILALSTVQLNAQIQCEADFNFSIIGGTTIVQFFDSSHAGSGQITSYSWNFGDGSSSTIMSPTHTYNTIGTYQVCHTITTSTGCVDSTCKNITIGTSCNLSAAIAYDSIAHMLIANVVGGTPPYNYLWSNGASISSIQVIDSGSYCVTVSDANGCVVSACYSFSGNGPCNALLTYNVVDSIVYFTNLSSGNYSYLLWNFGDGTTSSQQNPVHVYANGTWTVCLTLYDSLGNSCSQDCQTITINGGGGGNATLCGNLFWDTNGNGVMDAGENGIQQGVVYIYGNGLFNTVTTDSSGYYSAIVFPGTYSVYFCTSPGNVFTVPLNADSSGCAFYSVTITAGQSLCGLNFGIQNTAVTIEGMVFNDANNNGTLDGGETGIPYQSVQVGAYYAYTDATGNYSVNVPAGTYTIAYTPSGPYAGYALTTPGSIVVNATTVGNTYSGNNFGIYITPGSVNLSINIIPHTTVTPGFPAWYDLQVCNIGATPAGADVTMVYDPGLTFSYSTPAQSSINTTTHQITWTLPLISPGDCQYIWVDFDALISLTVGDNTFEFAMVTPTSGTDVDMSNNTDTVHQVVTSSWDPNNKLAVKTNNQNPTLQIVSSQNADQTIEYTINFQNTGTAPAVNIMVLDQLSADLDANTFELTGSSHNGVVTRNGSMLNFNFSNIMLPASTVNEPASHGFVSFRVKALNGLAAGHVISDNADIYFDFNAPVATNFANVTMISPTGINTNANTLISALNVYPNPVVENATLEFSLAAVANVNIAMLDIQGKTVETLMNEVQPAGQHSFTWSAAHVSKGTYLMKMEVNGSTSFKKINIIK